MVAPLRFAADDGSASQPHSSLTAALGDDYGAPSPVFHAFGATAAPVTISVQNRLIESLFSKNALWEWIDGNKKLEWAGRHRNAKKRELE